MDELLVSWCIKVKLSVSPEELAKFIKPYSHWVVVACDDMRQSPHMVYANRVFRPEHASKDFQHELFQARDWLLDRSKYWSSCYVGPNCRHEKGEVATEAEVEEALMATKGGNGVLALGVKKQDNRLRARLDLGCNGLYLFENGACRDSLIKRVYPEWEVFSRGPGRYC